MELYDWEVLPREQMNPSVSRRVVHSAHMTIARLEMKKGATVAEHHHVNEQVTMVERGALKFFIEGREEVVRAGGVLTIPPNAPHGVEVLEDTVAVDVFSPPRDDWKRGDDAYLRR